MSFSKPLKISIIVQGKHARRREEFTVQGISTFRDSYFALQLPDLYYQV
jgi:hypothetical protein